MIVCLFVFVCVCLCLFVCVERLNRRKTSFVAHHIIFFILYCRASHTVAGRGRGRERERGMSSELANMTC